MPYKTLYSNIAYITGYSGFISRELFLLAWSGRTHTHTYTHAHTYVRTYAHTHTHARTHTHAHARTHTRTHTHARSHTHTHTHAHTHAHTHTHTRTHTHAHTRTHVFYGINKTFCVTKHYSMMTITSKIIHCKNDIVNVTGNK